MNTKAIRARLHDYVSTAEDKKIESIYSLFEDQMAPAIDPWENEEFLAELDERHRRYEEGIEKTYTMEEVMTELNQLQNARESFLNEYERLLNLAETKLNANESLTVDEINKIVVYSKRNLDKDYKLV
jgi:hypothetical protein